MKTRTRAALGVLAMIIGTSVAAQPRPAGPSGPGAGPAAAPGRGGSGPRHGHGLPDDARALWIGGTLYFFAAGAYYLWSAERSRYEIATVPDSARAEDVIAYPSLRQSDEQQAQDRYECHAWAVKQSGFDPSTANRAPAPEIGGTYRRSLSACLQGRGYSVQ